MSEWVKKLRESKKIKDKVFGAGSDRLQIDEYASQNVYIPANPNPNNYSCLLMCILRAQSFEHEKLKFQTQTVDLFNQFVVDNKISRGWIPKSKLIALGNILKLKLITCEKKIT